MGPIMATARIVIEIIVSIRVKPFDDEFFFVPRIKKISFI